MYIVLKEFRDKYTNEIYPVGTILKLTKKRAKEILVVDRLIEEVKEDKED